MKSYETVSRKTYAGLFCVALATVMFEIVLTRIFSVSMWYHFAFVAISVAMFGMSVGAIMVYLLPGVFTREGVKLQLALSSLLFAVFIIISFMTHLSIPFITKKTAVAIFSIVFTYAMLAIPFIFSGIAVCLALTRFPRFVGRLYAADLAGAALGCVLLIYVMKITDGPTTVFLVALLALLGATFFAADGGHLRIQLASRWLLALLLVFVVVNTLLAHRQNPLIRMIWVNGILEEKPLFETWNSFSRLTVFGDPAVETAPTGWGLSDAYESDRKVRQLPLRIDASAATVMTAFNGNPDRYDYLKYDVTNIAHFLRDDARVLVVGAGGGRDILSALVFRQDKVLAIEINEDIISTVNERFGDFTGRLDQLPNVTFVNDEARSYISRMDEVYDILQISLIDTFAATAAGSFVLTENALYTEEAFDVFLNHLSERGILTISRWYVGGVPGEMYRLTALAASSLLKRGVENPRDHIMIVRYFRDDLPHIDGVGNILISPSPFSEEDVNTIERVAEEMEFDIILSPRYAMDETFERIASGRDLETFTENFPINIEPPTDDSPFFFNMLRFRNMFNRELWQQGRMAFNLKAVFILAVLIAAVLFLTTLCIIVPLILTTRRSVLRGASPFFLYFAGIGLGFMLIEISQMQRLIIFLGHPTYGLSVILFSLLLSSGIGSYLTHPMEAERFRRSAALRLVLLLIVLAVFGLVTPAAAQALRGETTLIRIAASVAVLFPIGLFMGMAFPIGLRLADNRAAELTPWLWGINGATSVCASVFAVAIALAAGISVSFWTGFACYVIAFLSFWTMSNSQSS